MSDTERKRTPAQAGAFQEGSGFGTQRSKPRFRHGAAGWTRARSQSREARRQGAEAARVGYPPLTEPERALAKEAAERARQLKRDDRALHASDPRRFRKIVRGAHSKIFRQRPGPKPDRQAARRILRAARQRARGTKRPELYERFLPGWKELNPVTRADAEDGFRRKVNKHRQRHQRMGIA